MKVNIRVQDGSVQVMDLPVYGADFLAAKLELDERSLDSLKERFI